MKVGDSKLQTANPLFVCLFFIETKHSEGVIFLK